MRLAFAKEQAGRQTRAHARFTQALPTIKEEDGTWQEQWMQEVEAWEEDSAVRNLYFIETKCRSAQCYPCISWLSAETDESEATLKLHLKEEDQRAWRKGEVTLHMSTPSACLTLGLMVEELQYMKISMLQAMCQSLVLDNA